MSTACWRVALSVDNRSVKRVSTFVALNIQDASESYELPDQDLIIVKPADEHRADERCVGITITRQDCSEDGCAVSAIGHSAMSMMTPTCSIT
jgi:hypothetical protein